MKESIACEGLQDAVWQLQQEVTGPKARFKPAVTFTKAS